MRRGADQGGGRDIDRQVPPFNVMLPFYLSSLNLELEFLSPNLPNLPAPP